MRKRRQQILSLVSFLRKWLWLIIGLGFAYAFIAGDTGFYNQIRLIREEKRLQREIARAKQERERLKKEVDSLKNDKRRLKIEAYKNGMAGKDEIIILFDDDEKK